jgi:hypothetical protein
MKVQAKAAVSRPGIYSNSEIPRWISEMSLEWLYELLASLSTDPARQS